MRDPRSNGRVFEMPIRVRLGDVTRGGHLRLEALIRHSQEISNEDTNDAGLVDDLAWIARSTVVDVIQPAGLNESLHLSTYCAGLGRTWAERRTRVVGNGGGHYEVATLWISIDPDTVRPRRLSEQFLEIYGEAAGDRKVSAKQRITHPDLPLIQTGERLDWTPRWGDFDTFGHMNNVVYWSALQHAIGHEVTAGSRLVIEHGAGVVPEDEMVLLVDRDPSALTLWWLKPGADGQLKPTYAAAARVIQR